MTYHRPCPLSVHPFSAVGRGHTAAGRTDDPFPMMGPVRRNELASWFCRGQQALLLETPECVESARHMNESDAYCCFPATMQCSTPFLEHNVIPSTSARQQQQQPLPPSLRSPRFTSFANCLQKLLPGLGGGEFGETLRGRAPSRSISGPFPTSRASLRLSATGH